MKKKVYLVLLFIWMGIIFFFSAQPSIESEISSNLATELIFGVLRYFLPADYEFSSFLAKYGPFIRKLAHFTEFMILGILAYINCRNYQIKRPLLTAIIFCVLYALSDEIHQLFVENRYCSFYDMMIDSMGSISGIILCHLISTRCQKE